MSNIDLLSLFKSVTGALQDNRESLNKADEYNANHGDNMVEIFDVITQAFSKKGGADPADQLAYASKLLGKKKSGSAQAYSQGLSQASNQFQGKQVTQDNAMQLIQTLLGAGEPLPSTNPLEGLLGGLLGGEKTEQQEDAGLDAGDLLSAGLAFMAAKDRGESSAEALVDAVVSASPLSQTPHRAQSSSLVANTLLEMLGSLASKK
jgi:hypothetical protein